MPTSSRNSRPRDSDPAITAVICASGKYDVLPDALASLEGQSLDHGEFEIVIVDFSADVARQRNFWADYNLPANGQWIAAPRASDARKIAADNARATLIAFLDENAIALPGWCAAFLETFGSHENIGSAGGPVEPIWPQGAPAWLQDGLHILYGLVDLGKHSRNLKAGESFATGNVAFRREALESIGGIDHAPGASTGFALSLDAATCSRLTANGFVSRYAPDARVLRRISEQESTRQWARRSACWRAISNLESETWSDRDAASCWSKLSSYFVKLPREMRGITGLFLDSVEPKEFGEQCDALTATIRLALLDGSDPEK